MAGPKLTLLRRMTQAIFLTLFLALLVSTTPQRVTGGARDLHLRAPVRLLFEWDTLIALANALATHALYRGLLWALLILIPTLFLGRFSCGWICPLGTLQLFVGAMRPFELHKNNCDPAVADLNSIAVYREKIRFAIGVLKSWPVFKPSLEADKVINLPIAKHPSLTGCTLGMKNWYGILGGNRNRLHQQIHQSVADLAAFMLPTVTLLDCYRVKLRNGPTGGNLEDVALKRTLVAGTDPVAIDASVAKAYWDLDAAQLPYLQLAAARGLGSANIENLAIKVSHLV